MGRQGVCLTAGPLLVILGGAPLFYIYASASMVPPNLEGWAFWSEVLSRMFNFEDAGWLSLFSSVVAGAGIGLFLWGLGDVVLGFVRYLGRNKRQSGYYV
jgi:hypothetical protein